MSVGPLDGLISGLSTSSVISQLMQVEAIPQSRLKSQKQTLDSADAAWKDINDRVAAIKTAADAVQQAVARQSMASTSSDPSVLTAVAGDTAQAGSLTFQVTQLATASQLTTAGFASSTAAVTTTGGTLAVSTGLAALGFTHVHPAGLAAGDHTIAVTTGSSAATLAGSPPASPITIAGGATGLSLTVNGATVNATLAAGSYTLDQVATALNAQTGPTAVFSVNNGALSLATAADGSTQTLGPVTGSAAAALGLGALSGASAAGSDAVVKVDGGAPVTVNPASGGTVTAGGLTLDLPPGGHLSAGSADVRGLTVAAGTTVSALASTLAGLGGPFGASTLDTGTGASPVRLVVSATGTGRAGTVSLDSDITPLASTTTLRSGNDAVLTVGSGSSAVTLTRSTNTVSGVLPGVTLSLVKASPGADVTVTSAPDDAGLTTKMQNLVGALNGLVGAMKGYTSYDPAAKVGGILLGDSQARSVMDSVTAALQTSLGGSVSSLNALGLMAQRDGTYSLDSGQLQKSLTTNRAATDTLLSTTGAVGSLFTTIDRLTGTHGVVTDQLSSLESQSSDLSTQIGAWDLRLADKQAAYRTQFASLETALAKMKNLQSRLASQTTAVPL